MNKSLDLCTTASLGSRPESEAVTTPLPDLDSALEVSVRVARSSATTARSPVHGVDLPETDIEGATSVLVDGVGVTTGFVGDDASAAGLVPAAELGAPGIDIQSVGTSSARASIATVAGAVTSTVASEGLDAEKKDDGD